MAPGSAFARPAVSALAMFARKSALSSFAFAFALLSAAPAPVVGQPTPFDPAEEEAALQVVAVLVIHARECSNNREYKQNAEAIRTLSSIMPASRA